MVAKKYFMCLTLSVVDTFAQNCPSFPVIDLGYAKHAPTSTNQTRLHNITYATYANIRFAQPPVGNLRFRRPQAPPRLETQVQNGSYPLNATDCLISMPAIIAPTPDLANVSWGSEDCLFLDVKVPDGLRGESVPVLHWLYGGGFVFGSKNWAGDPAALFQDMAPDQKFITVSSNYRLGALGWMSSPGVDMDANVGLWDGLAALEWTREHISSFGGDPNRITVIGESAGAGMAQHLLTLRGGDGPAPPFNQAIITSPGYRPHVNRSADMTRMYNLFLSATNCTDISCVRNLSTNAIATANRQLLFDVPSEGWLGPTIGYGTIIDGDLVTDVPDRLLAQGKYHTTVERVLTANMANDGEFATVLPATNWSTQLSLFMKTPTPQAISMVSNAYPNTTGTALWEFAQDAVYACHAHLTARAFGNKAYRYSMSIPPALHGQDQFYYLYTGQSNASVEYPVVARQMQAYFRRFILEGRTGGGGCNETHWPAYGTGQRWMNITSQGHELVYGESRQAQRCELLLQLINEPANGF